MLSKGQALLLRPRRTELLIALTSRSRCKAGIDVDGAPFGSVVHEGVSQPFMFLMSDHSGESDDESRWVAANFQSLYGQLPRDRTLRIMIRGANHFGFSDDLKSPLVMGVMRRLGKRLDGRRQLAVTAQYISTFFTFFDVNLQGAPASKLQCRSHDRTELSLCSSSNAP
jgi:hypothetical protein